MVLVIVLTLVTIVPLVLLGWDMRRQPARFEPPRQLNVLGGDQRDYYRSRGLLAILEYLREEPRFPMQILVTLVGIFGGGYLVISGGYSNDIENWAAGLVGLVIGYWLR